MRASDALALWQQVLTRSVRQDGPDLSARQMAILLSVYVEKPPHTVKGLAADLAISKPAVTRALDTLSQMGLIKRRRDPDDKRNVLIERTVDGTQFLSNQAEIMMTVLDRR